MPKVVVLLYHRVITLSLDPPLLSITPQHFADHLEILKKYYHTMPLEELVKSLKDGGRFPRRAVVVTFDDGYADNLLYAKPLLEHYDIPATVYVTSGYVGQNQEFWWDELERIFLEPSTLPSKLVLDINGTVFQGELGDIAHYDFETFQVHNKWNVLMPSVPTQRHLLYLSLLKLLRPVSDHERQKVLKKLRIWANIKPPMRSEYRPLTIEEVINLNKGKLVEIGSHTVNHSALVALPYAEQQHEIKQGKLQLEDILGHPMASFAYPFGSRSDYTDETVSLVKEAGFICACSNFGGLIRKDSDCFQLPRFMVMDWDGDEFMQRLEEWFKN